MEHENELKEALDFVSPSALTYDEWLMVGMALKDAGLPVTIWEQWSTRDAGRYHKGECVRKWESFHGGGASPVTASSIFQLAYSHGWSGPAGHALDWNDDISAGTSTQNEGRVGINSFGGGNSAKDFGSMENLLLALFVLVVILIFKHWTTGFLSSSAILIGILAGYVAAFVMGLVLPTTGVTADGVEFTKAWVLNWNKVAQASWFAIPKLMPVKIVFDMRAIMPVMIMFVVTAVETVGDISGVMEGGMNREPTDKELSGGVICDGLGSSFAALFGVLPNTSFSQNVGLVAMTKVVNRMALASGAIFLILCGLIPKLGALISIMPQAVLGGAAVMMFSSIVVSGIQLITKEKMTPRTLTIVSVALGVGYGMGANASILAHTPQFFQLICGESGIVPAAFVAIVLNVLLPKDDKAV